MLNRLTRKFVGSGFHFVLVMLSLIGAAAGFTDCRTSTNNPVSSETSWTISGKTYLIGSKDAIGGVTVNCGGVSTLSEADGLYQLKNVPKGTQIITAEYSKAQTYTDSIVVTSDLTYFVFMALQTTNLSGHISNVIDGPIDSARVVLGNRVGRTDISGHYSFSKVPQGNYTLTVTHPDYVQYQTRVTLASSDSIYDMCVFRELSVEGQVSAYKYIDESRAASSLPISSDNERLFLRANGTDSLGVIHDGIEQDVLLTIVFPRVLGDSRISLSDGSVQLFADSLPSTFIIKAFPIRSAWTMIVSFLTQPPLGQMLASSIIGRNMSGSYVTVLGVDGLNQLLASYQSQGVIYGVELKGGTTSSTIFYSSYSQMKPRILLKARY